MENDFLCGNITPDHTGSFRTKYFRGGKYFSSRTKFTTDIYILYILDRHIVKIMLIIPSVESKRRLLLLHYHPPWFVMFWSRGSRPRPPAWEPLWCAVRSHIHYVISVRRLQHVKGTDLQLLLQLRRSVLIACISVQYLHASTIGINSDTISHCNE